jgi:DNA-binding PadR family transcriptional regulator
MKRYEFVRLAVLMSIADDYEEPLHILECVSYDSELCGFAVAAEETQRALTDLTESGLAKAYKLSPPQEELDGVPPFDGSREYYFLITEEGLRTLEVWRKEWPFDDEGELIPGWPGLSG